VMVYFPDSKLGKLYVPADEVCVRVTTPVASSRASTWQPLRTAPELSVTVPLTPETAWAKSAMGQSRRRKRRTGERLCDAADISILSR
jgi:CelD/BcsL family acetyltransferase involved in cellulose biosynthesis